ncbi:Dipeptidyl aminopeptidase [Blyttiomyces sp. JEL0837]|nr:Dipeptidyl aminopeptidase [Blyttiomyces sp. JEL0837]
MSSIEPLKTASSFGGSNANFAMQDQYKSSPIMKYFEKQVVPQPTFNNLNYSDMEAMKDFVDTTVDADRILASFYGRFKIVWLTLNFADKSLSRGFSLRMNKSNFDNCRKLVTILASVASFFTIFNLTVSEFPETRIGMSVKPHSSRLYKRVIKNWHLIAVVCYFVAVSPCIIFIDYIYYAYRTNAGILIFDTLIDPLVYIYCCTFLRAVMAGPVLSFVLASTAIAGYLLSLMFATKSHLSDLLTPVSTLAFAAGLGMSNEYFYRLSCMRMYLLQAEIARRVKMSEDDLQAVPYERLGDLCLQIEKFAKLKVGQTDPVPSRKASAVYPEQGSILELRKQSVTVDNFRSSSVNTGVKPSQIELPSPTGTTQASPTARRGSTTKLLEDLPMYNTSPFTSGNQSPAISTSHEEQNESRFSLKWRNIKQKIHSKWQQFNADELLPLNAWQITSVRFSIRISLAAVLFTSLIHVPLDLETFCSPDRPLKSPSFCLDSEKDYLILKLRLGLMVPFSGLMLGLTFVPALWNNIRVLRWFAMWALVGECVISSILGVLTSTPSDRSGYQTGVYDLTTTLFHVQIIGILFSASNGACLTKEKFVLLAACGLLAQIAIVWLHLPLFTSCKSLIEYTLVVVTSSYYISGYRQIQLRLFTLETFFIRLETDLTLSKPATMRSFTFKRSETHIDSTLPSRINSVLARFMTTFRKEKENSVSIDDSNTLDTSAIDIRDHDIALGLSSGSLRHWKISDMTAHDGDSLAVPKTLTFGGGLGGGGRSQRKTSKIVIPDAVRESELYVDPIKKILYHVEGRPAEKGRGVIVAHDAKASLGLMSQTSTEISGANSFVRSRVHEYGGAAASMLGGKIVFSDFITLRMYLQTVGDDMKPVSEAKAITPDDKKFRYADAAIHPSLNHLIAVQEEHQSEHDVINTLAVVDLSAVEGCAGDADLPVPKVIASGSDFYSAPRFSPTGLQLAWIEWNHPNMPWSRSKLVVADWDPFSKSVSNLRSITDGTFSVSQPRWNPSDPFHLYFASDKTGYYNLYRYNINAATTESLHKTPISGDFSSPDWVFGASTYDFTAEGHIVAGYSEAGRDKIAVIDPASKEIVKMVSESHHVYVLRVLEGKLFMVAGGAKKTMRLVVLDLETSEEVVLKKLSEVEVGEEWISVAKPIEFPTDGGLTAHAYFYAPVNPNYEAAPGELPPLLIQCHGGPTAAYDASLSLSVQWWTSRGFAVCNLNYGGSSGYGREYRERLDGKWGIVDVADAANVAKYLAEIGAVDGKRVCINGGSAGGYTVLASLAFKPDVFAAGTSSYGICDLVSLAALTHKFEARYIDGLMGGNVKDIEHVYIERSPIHHVDKITAPVLILQGSEDRVVPPNQAELIVEAIKKKGGVVGYELFQGEGHGWKSAENIKKAFEREIEFYLVNLKIKA